MAGFDPKPYLTKIQGRDYLEVKWRKVWFRAVHPDGCVETDVYAVAEGLVVVRATVSDGTGKKLATGLATVRNADGREAKTWGSRIIEKAETAAIGRALAAAGFGTEFDGSEDDESDGNLADSPVSRPAKAKTITLPDSPTVQPWTKAQMTEFYNHWKGEGLSQEDILDMLGVKRLSEYKGSLAQANELAAADLALAE